jgi:SAM-dependent methyltransferase
LKNRETFFEQYLSKAPVALSFWRAFECEEFSKERLIPPVLDVGCGDGFFAQVAFSRILEAGIDLDESEVRRAVQSGSYRKAIHGSVTDLPFPPKSFKTVISNCVLEHVPDIDQGLKEIARVLKPGGRLMITVPSEYFSLSSFYQKWFKNFGLPNLSQSYIDGLNRIFKHHHVNHSKVWEIRFKKAGLKMEKARYFIPIPAFHSYERWLVPALPSKIWKLLFGRWVLLPRFWAKWLVPALVRKALMSKGEEGAAYFLIARKR